jgi:flavin-dependent dehydrogenase
MSEKAADLIVVGGGPAGTTLATLVKKYAPAREVILLEKCPGPRHHVGESLQPGINPVLKEMGVYEDVVNAQFPRKIGAVFIWGRDRKPWQNIFKDANNKALNDREDDLKVAVNASFQVRRSVYDEILLRHAEKTGVRVVRGALALSIIEEGGRIVGVTYRDAAGLTHERRSEFLADCSGQNGFLSKFRRVREHHPGLKNVAAFAYFKNARWKYRYSGLKYETKIFICSVSCGWFWYIPIDQDLVSVGFVTGSEYLGKSGRDLRALYFEELRKCAEIWPLLKDAQQVQNFDGTGQDFFSQNDWSYFNVAASGPGWLAAGDSAVFVDPILSSGALLAHLGAQRAAYTLLTQWLEPSAPRREALWRDFGAFNKEFSARFFAMAMFWYGNDRNTKKWWESAKEIQRAHLPVGLTDRTAFITISSGLSQYYDRLHYEDLLREEYTILDDQDFYRDVLKGDTRLDPALGLPPEDIVPRWLFPYTIEEAFLPLFGKGVMHVAKRMRFLKRDGADPLEDVFNPRRIVSPHHLEFIAAIDGRNTLAQIQDRARERGVPAHWVERRSLAFVKELALQGVLSLTRESVPPSRAGRPTRAKARRAPRATSRDDQRASP